MTDATMQKVNEVYTWLEYKVDPVVFAKFYSDVKHFGIEGREVIFSKALEEVCEWMVENADEEVFTNFYDFAQAVSISAVANDWDRLGFKSYKASLEDMEEQLGLPIGTTEQRLQSVATA